MYKPHPVFIPPDNPNSTIWRYMDLAKLISLLATKSLYFVRIDRLQDPYEGSFQLWMSKSPQKEEPGSSVLEFTRETFADSPFKKHFVAVNCWHLNEYESAALWSLYRNENRIAIKSSFQRLVDSFVEINEHVFIGRIQYVDYEDGPPSESGNAFSPVVHKRISFEHERELRAVVSKFEFDPETKKATTIIGDGLYIPVNLTTLIESIVITPEAPTWICKAVELTCRQFGIQCPVSRSTLLDRPPIDSAKKFTFHFYE